MLRLRRAHFGNSICIAPFQLATHRLASSFDKWRNDSTTTATQSPKSGKSACLSPIKRGSARVSQYATFQSEKEAEETPPGDADQTAVKPSDIGVKPSKKPTVFSRELMKELNERRERDAKVKEEEERKNRPPAVFEIFYDGGCKICMIEINHLKHWDDKRGTVLFTDITTPGFNAKQALGLSRKQIMERMHGRDLTTGEIVHSCEALRRMYRALAGWHPSQLKQREEYAAMLAKATEVATEDAKRVQAGGKGRSLTKWNTEVFRSGSAIPDASMTLKTLALFVLATGIPGLRIIADALYTIFAKVRLEHRRRTCKDGSCTF